MLGADEKITDIEPFQSDSLYLQIFQALFPQFDFAEIEQGKDEQEMAENISQLISLLEKNLLETDLSDIKASGIVAGDLVHIDEFLQVLLQVVFLMVQNQAEGEESEEEPDTIEKNNRDSSAKKANSGRQDKVGLSDGDNSLGELDNENKDETDTQKIAADLGLNSPDMEAEDIEKDALRDDEEGEDEKMPEMLRDLENEYKDQLRNKGFVEEEGDNEPNIHGGSAQRPEGKNEEMDDEHRFSDLDFYGQDQPDHKQIIDDEEDEEAMMLKQALKKEEESPSDKARMKELLSGGGKDGNKKDVDVMHDPLLPDGADFGNKKDKRARADSLGGGGSFKGGDLLDEDEDMMEINDLEDLDEEQKYMVLQHLFDEYQKDPDSFPPEQRELLEYEMMKLYQKADEEGELDEEEFDEMRGASSGKKRSNREKSSEVKQKPRLLQDESEDEEPQASDTKNLNVQEEEDDEQYMKDIINQQNEAEAEREEQHKELEKDMEDDPEQQDEEMEKDSPQEEPQQEEREGEGEEEQLPIPIDEEEFNKLSPEQQQEMIYAIQQQMAGQQMEGEGEGDVAEMDPEEYNLMQQQMLQQQQMAGMGMRKKRKSKKKKRPSTAKSGWNPSRSRISSKSMRRPGTAKSRRKSRARSKKRRQAERQQLEWIQHQQMQQQMQMQQLALQQVQQAYEPSDEDMAEFQQYVESLQDENGNPIEPTEEQAQELQQQFFFQKQQEFLLQQGVPQVDEEGNVVGQLNAEQIEALQQQIYMQQMQAQPMRKKKKRKASAKRRGSKKKGKRGKRKNQQMDEQAAFMAMLQNNPELQQQFLAQQQMQAEEGQAQAEEMYGVDKIDEEEMEESPMKPHSDQNPEERNHERPTEESGEEGQVMANNYIQENMEEGQIENDENQQMLANMSPDEIAFYQQKAAEEQQMAQYQQDENGNMYYQPQNMYMQNQGGNTQENLNNMLREYAHELNRKETKRRKKAKKSNKNRRRSFANMYGNSRTHNVNNMVSYKRGVELKQKIKRDVKQVKLVKKIYMLANEIERNRLQEEKRRLAEMRRLKKSRMRTKKDRMKDRYQEQLQMLRQSIENERMDRKIAKFARTQAMKEWKRDLSRRQPQMALSHGSYS